MKTCRYHPLEAAAWLDPVVDYGYCERCVEIKRTDGERLGARSYVGGRDLEALGGSRAQPAFWEALPQIINYVLRPAALTVLGVFVVLAAFCAQLPEWVDVGAILCIAFLLTGYGGLILLGSAEGGQQPPQPTALGRIDTRFSGSLFVLNALVIALPLLVAYLGQGALAALMYLLLVCLYPGWVMSLVMHRELADALSVQQWIEVFKRIPGDYVVLTGFVLLLSLLGAGFYNMLQNEVPQAVLYVLSVAVLGSGFLIVCHTIGYSIHHAQYELDYQTREGKAQARRLQAIDPVEAKLLVLVKAGQYDVLRGELTKVLKKQPRDVRKHEWLHRLLVALGDEDALFDHADVYLLALQQSGDDARLYYLFESLRKRRADFVPNEPELRHVLAEQALMRGKQREALQFLHKFHERYPNYPRIADAYLVAAKCFMALEGEQEKARTFLRYVQQKYPNSPATAEARALLDTMA